MRIRLTIIVALLACWSMNNLALAQKTLDEKRKHAEELFEDKKWIEAEALYASVITDSPRNHDLNFRYGTCILIGSKNHQEAIRFLKYSITGAGIDKRAYYYLGRAYHLNYQFNEAITYYTKFKELASPSDLKDLDVVTDLKACAFGKKLMSNITDMIVIKKDELPADDFYDKYDLRDIGGQLLVTDIFQTKLDKKLNHRPIIHFPSNSPYVYYSSYGENGDSGLDIYVKKRLTGGEWSLAEKVKGGVNTDLDENFAYMHPNGEYLYFSSKGHNSMGGYDVFRSKYNQSTQSFGPSENMDFAISSPDDDIFFVVDSLNQNAFFASSRESAYGNLSVYKVRVDRIPMQMAAIKGNFLNAINAEDKEVEIEVTDFSSGELIGNYNSKQTNGDYLLTFPKSGKYQFAITVKGSMTTYGHIVTIPPSKEFKPLGQEMTLENYNGEERITVKDQFNKVFDDPEAILAEVYRELSRLPPNSTDFNLDSLDALKETDKVLVDAGLDTYLTKEGLKAVLKDEIEDLTEVRDDEQKQANIAFNLALEKSIEANQKMVELNKQIKLAENTEDPIEKNRILADVKKQKAEIEQLNNESQVLIDLAESIEKSIADKQSKIDNANTVYTEAIGLEEGNRDALLALVSNNSDYFEENVKGNPPLENATTKALKVGAQEQKKVQDISEEISDINREKRKLIAANEKLEKQKANAKKKEIEVIQRQIESNNSDIAVLESNIDRQTKELDNAISENKTVREGLAASIILKDDYQGSKYENEVAAGDKSAIKTQVKSNNLEESIAMVDEVLENNNVSAVNIDLYGTSETTEGYSLAEWDEAIDEKQEILRQEKLNASAERQAQIQTEIDKLERLRQDKIAAYDVVNADPRSIKSEINEVAHNNEEIAIPESKDVDIAAINISDFNSAEGSAVMSEFDKEIAELNDVNVSLEDLRNQLDASTDEKEQAKIQKQIDKEERTKASIENDVIEGLDGANDSEVASLNSDLEMDMRVTKNASHVEENGLSEEIQKANENIIIARQKMDQAQDLRVDADGIKDPILANEKLIEAYKLENEAKDLLKESKRIFRMAISLNDSADEEDVITSVSDNVDDRKSTEKMTEAARLRDEANALYIRSGELADSSVAAKKKHQAPIIQKANVLNEKANVLSSAADEIEDEANDLKVQEDEILARTIATVQKNVDGQTQKEIGTSDAYKDYFEKKNEADDLMDKVDDLDEEIATLKDKRARMFKMAIALDNDNQETADVDDEISDLQTQINELIALKKQLKDDALKGYDAANEVLNHQTDQAIRENLMALEQNNIEPFEKAAPEAADFEVPTELTEDIFRTTDGAVYSDSAPIPMNNKRTGGLVYKVQVGAFRNPLPQDHFKEFAPISGEVLNNGITRFMVGYFKNFAPANDAKGKINGIGYSDAFIVAYCNGERITIDRAKLIEEGLINCDSDENFVDNTIIDNNTSDNTTTDNTTANTTTDNTAATNFNTDNTDQSNTLDLSPQTNEERALTNYYTSVPDAADANQIEIIKGLFYTVQIGVFSQPVPNSALLGIQPLNSQRIPNDFIRYSTGIFTSVEAATVRKNEVIALGIQDAFVTAYFDGERITVDESLVILSRDGAESLVGNQTTNVVTEPEMSTTTTSGNEKIVYKKDALYYKILIGKYREAIPGEYATFLLRVDEEFETEVDQDGRTLLISARFRKYEEMIKKLNEFAGLGIEDMRIITYYKYDVIPFEQGQKIRFNEELDELTPYYDIEGISAAPFIFAKESVYFKIKLGEFKDKISPEFTNILLLHQIDESIIKEETVDGVSVFFAGVVATYEEAEAARQRLLDKGFDRAIIVAYHKYNEISVETARNVLDQ